MKCNVISLSNAVKTALQKYYTDALDAATDQLLDLMQKEVLKTIWGDGPGKPAWREKISRMLRVVNREAAEHYIEHGVGLPDQQKQTDLIKAMIIEYGAGLAVGNPPIKAGPTGRMVWDDDITGRFPSEAMTSYELPKEFNQVGNFFVENAMKLMKKHFNDILEAASRDLPDSIFYQNVIVKQG